MNKRMNAAYVVNSIQGVSAAAVAVMGWWLDSPITVAVGGLFFIEATLWRGLRGPRQ
jgi:hypothetical protein